MNSARFVSRVAYACVAILTSSLAAAPLDDRIPQDALLYIGWQGTDALTPQYTGSNLQHLLDSSGLHAYFQQQMPNWIEQAGNSDAAAPARIESAMTALGILWRHPVAIYMGAFDFTKGADPQPRIAVLCDAGKDADALVAFVKKAADNPAAAPHVTVTKQGTMVIVTGGSVTAAQFAVKPNALRANADYQRTMKIVGGDGAYSAYFDAQKLLASINDGLARDSKIPPAERARAKAVIHTLGLEHFTQGATRGGFDGPNWSDAAFLGTTGPRTGILALLATKPLDDAALAPVSADAVAFNVGHVDFPGILALVREALASADPQLLNQFNTALVSISGEVGFDIEKDLIASLGDLALMYRTPSPDGVGIATALVQQIKDPIAFARALTGIETQINEKAGGRIQVEPLDAEGIPVSAVQSPFASAAWTVRSGYFYVSSLGAISAVVNQVEKHQPSITTREDYKKAIAALPSVKPTTITYSDPGRLYPEAYRSLSLTLPLLRAARVDIPMRLFPTPAKATLFMAPGASISWQDADGLHFAGKSCFPGVEIVSGNHEANTPAAILTAAEAQPNVSIPVKMGTLCPDAARTP